MYRFSRRRRRSSRILNRLQQRLCLS
jgi:hypothetical protein